MVERQGVDDVVVKGPVEADVSKHISDQYDDIICIHIKLRVPIPSHMVHTCRVESCQKPTWRQQNVSVYFLGGCWVLRCVVSRVYIIGTSDCWMYILLCLHSIYFMSVFNDCAGALRGVRMMCFYSHYRRTADVLVEMLWEQVWVLSWTLLLAFFTPCPPLTAISSSFFL